MASTILKVVTFQKQLSSIDSWWRTSSRTRQNPRNRVSPCRVASSRWRRHLPRWRLAPAKVNSIPLPREAESDNSSLFRFHRKLPLELWCDTRQPPYSCHVPLQQVAQRSAWRVQCSWECAVFLRVHHVLCCALLADMRLF